MIIAIIVIIIIIIIIIGESNKGLRGTVCCFAFLVSIRNL